MITRNSLLKRQSYAACDFKQICIENISNDIFYLKILQQEKP